MTRGSVYLSSEEYSKGAILRGKSADLALLSNDYFTVPEEEIRSIQSVLTVVVGKIVCGTEEFAKLPPALPKIVPSWSPVLFYGVKYGCCWYSVCYPRQALYPSVLELLTKNTGRRKW